MKKLLLSLVTVFFLFSCDNDGMDKDQEQEKPKIYKASYDGDNNTEGVIPADNSLYAEGDKYSPKWDYLIKRNGNRIIAWELIGEVSSVEKPYKIFPDGKYWVDRKSVITIGGNDIGFKAVYFEQLPPERFTITYHSEGHLSGEVPQDLNTYTADDDVILLPPNEYNVVPDDWNKYKDTFINDFLSDDTFSLLRDDLCAEYIKEGYILGSLKNVPKDNPLYLSGDAFFFELQRSYQQKFAWVIDGVVISRQDSVTGKRKIKINKNTDVNGIWNNEK
jgi:hypothetical protein